MFFLLMIFASIPIGFTIGRTAGKRVRRAIRPLRRTRS